MLNFFLIFLSILFLFAIFSRHILRWAFQLLGRKLQKQFEEAQQEAQKQADSGNAGWAPNAEQHDKGEVTVHIPPKQPRRRKQFTGGEYVDFEEVRPSQEKGYGTE